MPSSRILIASNTLSSSVASVTFSSIPSTYTDLVLRMTARSDISPANPDYFAIVFNGITTNYSRTQLINSVSNTISSASVTNAGKIVSTGIGSNNTANTFGSAEIYIPNYATTNAKPISAFGVAENNGTTGAENGIFANLWNNSATISSFVITSLNVANFVSGSSFYLYGIKNS